MGRRRVTAVEQTRLEDVTYVFFGCRRVSVSDRIKIVGPGVGLCEIKFQCSCGENVGEKVICG